MFATGTAPLFVSIIGTAFVVATFVQLTKFLLNYLAAPGTPNQNSIVRLYVFVVSAVVVCAIDFLSYHLGNRADILNAAADALNVGAIAIASYHVLGSDVLPTPPVMLQGLSAAVPSAIRMPVDPEPPMDPAADPAPTPPNA